MEKATQAVQATPARTVREFKNLMRTDPKEVLFVRNMDDWKAYCADAVKSGHPLHHLTKEALQQFTQELVFRGGGIAGANVSILENTLTFHDYQMVLAAFGMSVVLADDNKGFACVGVGDCAANDTHICTSNC